MSSKNAVEAPSGLRGIQVASPYVPGRSAPRRQTPVDFRGQRIHFMGAGGIGVSAMMELCAARGAIVSGCDCSKNAQVAALQARGIQVAHGHDASHVADCDELVYTAAVEPTHPEVQEALRTQKITSIRMRMLGRILRGTRNICVTGSHGKTTTTWLIGNLLMAAGRDPSVLVGGVVKALNGNVHIGKGAEFVVETDESDNRLHEVTPTIPVLTNIDNDHMENYGSVDALEEAFTRFMASLDANDPNAVLIGCGDDIRVRRTLQNASLRCRRASISYGLSPNCDVIGMNLRPDELGWHFDVLTPEVLWENLYLPMPGEHNVRNALAAVSIAWYLRIPEQILRNSLAHVERVARRFEVKGIARGVRVVDDYGHHPTEIEATLKAARTSTTGRLAVLFQPHRFTRTRALMAQFGTCFKSADVVHVLPVYAASEKPIPGADHNALVDAIRAQGQENAYCASNRAEAVATLLNWVRDGDTVVTQGAGDVTGAADELVAGL